MTQKCVATVVLGVDGIELKPIRLRKSLYLLIPMEVAKLIGVTDKTKFVLTLKQNDEYVLMYHKVEPSPNAIDRSTEAEPGGN